MCGSLMVSQWHFDEASELPLMKEDQMERQMRVCGPAATNDNIMMKMMGLWPDT
jgi:hypothetical protein